MNSSMCLIVWIFDGENVPQHLYTIIIQYNKTPYVYIFVVVNFDGLAQAIFELKEVYQLSCSADCRIRTLEVWDTRHIYTSWSYIRMLYIYSIVVSDRMHIKSICSINITFNALELSFFQYKFFICKIVTTPSLYVLYLTIHWNRLSRWQLIDMRCVGRLPRWQHLAS